MHFVKRNKLSILYFIWDSGNEFQRLSDAYEHTVVAVVDVLAKVKLVAF